MALPTFDLLDPTRGERSGPGALASRTIPRKLSDHRAAAAAFRPSDELVAAVNVALSVGAPLLLTGEPGTGKTQVAFYLAWYFGIQDALYPLYVRSTTTASDLLYEFDAVAYFHAAHDPQRTGAPIERSEFVRPGPLWEAFRADGPAVVLIDEVDKAPRDFPNDLLNALDQHRFQVRETGEWVERAPDAPPPVVVITSNSDRRLPEPFLRRCIFHHIEFTPELLKRAVQARVGDFPRLDEATRRAALERFLELRDRPGLRKKPATAELLVWLAVLSARDGVGAAGLADSPLRELPALGALVKDRDDYELL